MALNIHSLIGSRVHVQLTNSPLGYKSSRFDFCLYIQCYVTMSGQAGHYGQDCFKTGLDPIMNIQIDFSLCIGHRRHSVTLSHNSYSGQMLNVFTYWLFYHQLSHFWKLASPFSLGECLLNLFFHLFIEELYPCFISVLWSTKFGPFKIRKSTPSCIPSPFLIVLMFILIIPFLLMCWG